MDFLHWLATAGGVCTTAIASEHISERELRELRRRGALRVPLRGWVALDGVDNDVTRALGLGGVVSCVSAFRSLGLWTPHGDRDLHIRVHRETHSARLARASRADGMRVHTLLRHLPERRPWDGTDSIPTSLAVAAGCVAEVDLIAAADSALRAKKLHRDELHDLTRQLPKALRRSLERASEQSGSGSESTFAAMLHRAQIAFTQQPELLPGEFCDFLIGKSLVVEVDSLEWHGSRKQMANDRRRDAALTMLGYRVLRFTYEQVMFEPQAVMAIVLDLVRRNVHRRAPITRDA
ncbi:DUF559 domain-containing protein [Agrococcus sp. ARC_14]|uniref:endonuclease domain-containing protein n=1 Tax=Agrococcus sp. ARC_14 TaxID=2919927 RepID=UPI001F0576F0|nr:DUF559 domain-containing protein [Agrococcus sp. ARC_14]MCH1882119.1 endonuclease domain-containing protein [Agrococcus sp. ARC_14]